ncbi:Fic family protein [Panacibacter sp. DH6]|uniref:Fic family protein n=1 Tax=Panacibacter microcysteis TaxID=2793269 RepID=A0A931E945_9BACT|nr:Fic family protein [Panacibacter microcysteis]MBG9377585.1 Fic family protein [Panacibacter microcysteis]
MSKIILSISFGEFIQLLKMAQEYHAEKDEPIPEISQEHIPKIESCLNTPFGVCFGEELYRGFINKASMLFYLIIANHALGNGNKRMAIFTLQYFCVKNGYFLDCPPKILRKMAKEIAQPHIFENKLNDIKKMIRRYMVKAKL